MDLDQGFSLNGVRVHPLDYRIDGSAGRHVLSPIAMEILCTLARSGRGAVLVEHLINQIWGAHPPDEGTLEHYIHELEHFLNQDENNKLLLHSAEPNAYWLAQAPEPLPVETGLANFFTQLQERKVTHTGVLYLVGAWLIIQVADIVLPALGIDDSVVRLVVFTSILGFPLALLLSWFYDVEKTDDGGTASSWRSVVYISLGVLLAVPLALGYQWMYGEDETQPATARTTISVEDLVPNSIAVLAFTNLSDSEKSDYFADGLAEEILNALSSVGKMRVVPRTSSFAFKGTNTSMTDIGYQLGARYLLEGSVRRQDENVRISARLVDVVSGFPVWAQSYKKEISDIFDVQEDISRQVVGALNIILSAEENEQLGAAQTSNIEAYDFYLQGRDYLRLPTTEQTLNSAIQLFMEAIDLDPNYADAYAGLCDSYLEQYVQTKTNDWFSKAEQACDSTLRFDVVTVDVRIALGNLYRESGQPERAVEQLNIAHTKAPSNVDAVSALARALAAKGDLDDAEQLFQKAIGLQPRFWSVHNDFGNYLFNHGRSAEAIPLYQKAVSLTPRNATALNNLGAALLMSSRFEEAAEAWKDTLAVEITDAALSNAGTSFFLAGRFDAAADMYKQATELSPDNHLYWSNLADAQRFSSAPGKAAAYYKKAIDLAEGALQINPNDALTQTIIAHCASNTGDVERARTLLDKTTIAGADDLFVWYYAALTRATLGEKEAAAEAVKNAIELGYPIDMLLSDRGLESVTSDPTLRAQAGL